MTAYYNENDPYAAQWLRNLIKENLIAPGDVDERSVVGVRADDLIGYSQCHFFAGIGGWSYALRLAGWPADRPVWTGSCPCQPFSEAGKRRGFADKRDLWPTWFGLIGECRPAIIFGEQVANGDGNSWAARCAFDLEAMDYAFGAAVLPAISVGSPQRRDRYYFVSHPVGADSTRRHENRRRSPLAGTMALSWDLADWNGGFGSYGRLADGLSGRVAKRIAGGFGNAIVPQLAAEFIKSATGL